jgi:hypothetical protein
MRKYFKKSILSILALLPIPGFSYTETVVQNETPHNDNLKLESMNIDEFRALMFPVHSQPIKVETAYLKFRTLFANQNETESDVVFTQYVDELIKTDRLITDGKILYMGNVSGGYQSK